MDLNLDTLKREIVDSLETSGLAIFYSSPGGLEGQPMVLWDTERHPEYGLFLEAAKLAGAHMILFAARELETTDIDELQEQIRECELARDEQREIERRLRDIRVFEGRTCMLEMAFSHEGRLYVYEASADWYDEFLEVEEEIQASLPDESDGDDSLGGPYFSRN